MAELPNETRWTEADFLTPEQRLNAVAEILAIIALRAAKAGFSTPNHENQDA